MRCTAMCRDAWCSAAQNNVVMHCAVKHSAIDCTAAAVPLVQPEARPWHSYSWENAPQEKGANIPRLMFTLLQRRRKTIIVRVVESIHEVFFTQAPLQQFGAK